MRGLTTTQREQVNEVVRETCFEQLRPVVSGLRAIKVALDALAHSADDSAVAYPLPQPQLQGAFPSQSYRSQPMMQYQFQPVPMCPPFSQPQYLELTPTVQPVAQAKGVKRPRSLLGSAGANLEISSRGTPTNP